MSAATECRLCKAIAEARGPSDVFSLGFCAGAFVAVERAMPSLCEKHMARLAAVAGINGIDLVHARSKEHLDEIRSDLTMSAIRVPNAGAKS